MIFKNKINIYKMVNITSFNCVYNKIHKTPRVKNDTNILREYFLTNYENIFDFVCKTYTNINSQKRLLAELKAFLLKNNIRYEPIHVYYKQLCDKFNKDQLNKEELITAEQKEKLIRHEDYIDLYYKNKYKLDLCDLFIISLYILHPPRRIKDYHLLQYKNGNNKIYYENEKMFMSLNDYKTSKKYGEYIVEISDELRDIIEEYITKFNLKENDFFFDYSNSCSLSARIKNINLILTGKKMTLNDLRHIYISKFLQSNPSIKQKNELAKQMAHSIGTQAKYNYRNL